MRDYVSDILDAFKVKMEASIKAESIEPNTEVTKTNKAEFKRKYKKDRNIGAASDEFYLDGDRFVDIETDKPISGAKLGMKAKDIEKALDKHFKHESDSKNESPESVIENPTALIQELRRLYDQVDVLISNAGFIPVQPAIEDPKLGDRSNPLLGSLAKIRDDIGTAISYAGVIGSDPMPNEDEMGTGNTGADAPVNPELQSAPTDAGAQNTEVELEESDNYYRQMNPDKVQDEILNLNGWNYSKGEIWDDQGVCSICYDPEKDCICVSELMDPDGIDQEVIAEVNSVEELDTALTQFVELDEIASEMKQAFAEYIEQQRGTANEAVEDQSIMEEPPVAQEATIIDDWEYMAQDPEFNNNPTLLYDKGDFVVFIQRDSDPENKIPYYVNALDHGDNFEHEAGTIDELCKWLEVENLPVPTEDAKLAIKGLNESVNESKEEEKQPKDYCKKLPDGMKRVKDDPSITTLAKDLEDPKVAKVEEPKKNKKK